MSVPSGLRPIAVFALALFTAGLLTTVARLVTSGEGFFVERTVTIIVLGLGLTAATLLYWRACMRALRDRANPWALGVSALIVAAPVILAIVFPQNPAP